MSGFSVLDERRSGHSFSRLLAQAMTTGLVNQAALAEERGPAALPCRLFSGRLIGSGVMQIFDRQRLGTPILAVAAPLV